MDSLMFKELREASMDRSGRFGVDWGPAEWGLALAGEAGELCNVLKKMIRQLPSDPDIPSLKRMAGEELADVIIYADLLSTYLGLDLGYEVRKKFNAVSERYGFPERIKSD